MRKPPARLKLTAVAADEGLALDAFLVRRGGITEALAREAIERGGAFLRGKRVRDPLAPVRARDLVEVSLRTEGRPSALGRDRVLHLDRDVLVVDKPAGVTAQEDRAGGESLPDLCSALLAEMGEPTQALLVHRLDRGTTGVTLLARNQRAHAFFLEEFRERHVTKEYRALATGVPATSEGVVELALGADPRVPGLRRHDPQGDAARTRYSVLERLREATLFAAFPETGRTHQIRVHLRELGHPILGDGRYGGASHVSRPDGARHELARPMLHALSLELRHPSGRALCVRAFEPADFLAALAFLRG